MNLEELSSLVGVDLGGMAQRVMDVVRDPTQDPKAAALLIAIVTLGALLIMGAAVLFILARPEEDEEEYWDQPVEAGQYVEYTPAPERKKVPFLVKVLFPMVVLFGVWGVAGYFTSQPSTCASCHVSSPHSTAGAKDPHGSVQCIGCHETGGVIGQYTYQVVPRTLHFVAQIAKPGTADGYARNVASSSCARCHESALNQTVLVEDSGVRISHKEPLASGAQCLDCHKLNSGIVSLQTVGMSPCLRCHDGKVAASGCVACHTKDVGFAVKARSEVTQTAGVGTGVIDTPNCYACHKPNTCDSCHGIRMPHTREFMAHGHARAAAEDMWFNGSRTCKKCHTDTHNPCGQCHPGYGAGSAMPSHGQSWAKSHQAVEDPVSCSQGCHGQKTGSGTRVICAFCHEKSVYEDRLKKNLNKLPSAPGPQH